MSLKTHKVNFHTHTNYSFDGYNSFQQIYLTSKKIGLTDIVITDHDTIEGGITFKKWLTNQRHDDLNIIVGEEITCSDGTHIIGLFLKSHIEGNDPITVIKDIKAQNGLVYFPHPSRKDGIMKSKYKDEAIEMGDFWEIFNGKIKNSYNEEASTEYIKYPHLLALGGSDAHYNIDLQKCICEISSKQDLETTLRSRKEITITIFGKPKNEGELYHENTALQWYYANKDKLNVPFVLRNIAKRVYPFIKNIKDRTKKVQLQEIYTAKLTKNV